MLRRLAHYSVRAADLAISIAFYTDVLGLKVGPRPPFSFPGAWLYLDGDGLNEQGCVHLIGTEDEQALEHYLGAGGPAGAHTGALDHIAFLAGDWAGTRRRLRDRGVPFADRVAPILGVRQVFLTDPDGMTIELNFPEAAAV